MRDIKPTKRLKKSVDSLPPEDLPPDAKELYRKHAPSRRGGTKLTGSKVPVAAVRVPRPSKKQRSAFARKQVSTTSTRPPHKGTTSTPISDKAKSSASLPSMNIGRKERSTIIALAALIVIVIGLAAIMFLPKADIELILQTAPLLVDQELTLSSHDTASPDVIPGKAFVREVRVEGVSPVLSTEVVGEKAKGIAHIVNRTLEEQKIKERSRLVTKDGILFFMQSHAIVPPAGTGVPTRVSVEIEAAKAGKQGNIEPQRLDFVALGEDSRAVIYAETTQPLKGGSGEEVHVIQEEDITQARNAAGQAARQQVEQSIRAELPKGWTILEESWAHEIQSFDTEATILDQQDTISYTAQVRVRVMSYEESKLEERLKAALENRLDEDYMLFPGAISYTKSVDATDWEKGEATITTRVTHTTVRTFSLETLQEKLSTRTKEEAQTYLEGLRGVQSVTIELWPFWVQRIPRIEKRIDINLISDRTP